MSEKKITPRKTAQSKNQERPSAMDKDLAVDAYREMCFYRRFEECVGVAYTRRKFSGFCHLHIGQEAVCVGIQKAMKESDYLISGYRSHTQAISKGITPGAVMAELFGKIDGVCRGKGGSMHMFDRQKRFFGGHGIVGGQVPIATGVGFKIRYHNESDVCICLMGDAATNQGAFHEALNMAATWQLPVLFVIENNRYGMGTDIRRTTSVDHLWKRALAFDMDHSDVDGMDVQRVYFHVKEILDQMRANKKPHLLEALTYRYRGHSVSDPGNYRSKEEVKDYQEHNDPIKKMANYLLSQKFASEAELKEWDQLAKKRAADAEAFADQSPVSPVDEAFDHNLHE